MFVTFHEHIIRVSQGPQDGITSEDLWKALLEFVRRPHFYVEHLTNSQIISEKPQENGTRFERQLNFDKIKVEDVVDALPESKTIITHVKPSSQYPESSLLIRIEEPEADTLFIRFIDEEEQHDENPLLQDLRRQAYEAKDQHLVEGLLSWIMEKKKHS